MAQDDPYKYFRVEAAELVELLGQAALAIDHGAAISGGVAALLRHAHTLKGAARVVRQLLIADRAHAIEDLLAPHRSSAEPIPVGDGARLLAELDAIAAMLAKLGTGASPPLAAPAAPPPAASASPLRLASSAEPTPAPPAVAERPRAEQVAATVRAEVGEVEAVVEGLGESLVELEALKGTLGALEQVRQLGELLGRQLMAPRRADAERLAGALERAQAVVQDLKAGLGRIDGSLRSGFERLGRELAQTHTAAERLRLVPARSIFNSLERAVYDAAREVGKPATLASSGGDVKLDSHVLGVAHGALLHVVRNSVAHGLESAVERARLGKAAVGTITLSVSRRGRDVVFSCRDDGAGLDLGAVRRVLRHTDGELEGQDEDQILRRLLRGGISTSGSVTRLSGRGVGLDVVREAAERLGGSVALESARGKGFSVELCVPLSIAAVSAVVVECAGRTLALPLESVVLSVRLGPSDITCAGSRESICHAGQVIPFAPLGRALGTSGAYPPKLWSALIVSGPSGQVAVGVDRLLGARSLVLRPLPEVARGTAVVAGATLDALGNPALVLDSDALVVAVQRLVGVEASPPLRSRPILVIDDSLTTRMLEQSILESAGYEVALATSGEEGLDKARARPYALFLVDVEMPGIDGFTFVDRARHDPALANVPAVLVSSRSAPEDFARGKAVGAHGYIVKDRFDQHELLGLIERLVSA